LENGIISGVIQKKRQKQEAGMQEANQTRDQYLVRQFMLIAGMH
jgi:hypothetical protein